jgi:hypothetical protein
VSLSIMKITSWDRLSLLSRICLLTCLAVGVAVVNLVAMALLGFDPLTTTGLLLANTFATPTNVMAKVAIRLTNNAVFAHRMNCNRALDSQFKLRGVKQGQTIYVRLPQRYELTVGAKMTATPLTDTTVPVTISDQTNIGFEYDGWAEALEVDDYMERYAAPAVDQLVNNIDFTGLNRMYKAVAKTVGVPAVPPGSSGTLPQSAMQPYVDIVTKLTDAAVPTPYIGMLSPNMHGYLVTGTAGLFNPSGLIAAAFRKGQFKDEALGIDRWYKNQNTPTHTIGALGSTPLVVGAGQVGSSIALDGAGGAVTGYVLEGDNIRFAGVNDINPLNHQSTGQLKDFVVTADADANGSGEVTVSISPELIISGPWQTASAAPANDAAVTVFGHASTYAGVETKLGLVYNKEAFVCAMADLVLPRGLWVAERIRNEKLGISVRMLKDSDIINDVYPCRLDTAHGWSAVRQELAGRVCG